MAVIELTSPNQIAERGEAIYKNKYQPTYEIEHAGKFVAIDVLTEHAYLGDTPEEALERARAENQRGVFHLMKVGSLGAFRVSYSRHGDLDWLF